ncbi:unnamed protein product [Thelazia callipaeda]|uniref:Uncharacterized protein n=1 Tax=Thelazia callipaeda TaxID=103827 RepID=A0A0N5D3D1_THECL|nr:unnamed protein product [Thelazia callipaeda]
MALPSCRAVELPAIRLHHKAGNGGETENTEHGIINASVQEPTELSIWAEKEIIAFRSTATTKATLPKVKRPERWKREEWCVDFTRYKRSDMKMEDKRKETASERKRTKLSKAP